VRISHCTFKRGLAALQLKSRAGRGGYLENVEADHLTVGPEPLLELESNYSFNADPQGVPGVDGITRFSNVRISDVTVDSTNLFRIKGTVEKPVDGLRISHVTGTCKKGSVIENARDMVLSDVRLEGVSGPEYFTNNVEGSGFDGAAPLESRNRKR